MRSIMRVTSRQGHTETMWDTDHPAGDGNELCSVEEVRAEFDRLIALNFVPFEITREPGKPVSGEMADRKFDPEVSEYLMAAPMMGGC